MRISKFIESRISTLFLSLSVFWTFNYLSWHDECLAIKSQVHLENYWTDLWCFAWHYLPQVGIRTNQPESSPSPGPGPRMPSPGVLSLILNLALSKSLKSGLFIWSCLFRGSLNSSLCVLSQLGLLTFELRFPGFWSMFSALHLWSSVATLTLARVVGWEWGLPIQLYSTDFSSSILNTPVMPQIITCYIFSSFSNSFWLIRWEGCLTFSTKWGKGNPSKFSLRKMQ